MGKKNRKNEGTAKPDAQQTANENQSMVAAAIAVDADMILSDSNVKDKLKELDDIIQEFILGRENDQSVKAKLDELDQAKRRWDEEKARAIAFLSAQEQTDGGALLDAIKDDWERERETLRDKARSEIDAYVEREKARRLASANEKEEQAVALYENALEQSGGLLARLEKDVFKPCEEQVARYAQKVEEYIREKADLENLREDVEDDKRRYEIKLEKLKERKRETDERWEQCSPSVVEELKNQRDFAKKQYEICEKQRLSLENEVAVLHQFAPENDGQSATSCFKELLEAREVISSLRNELADKPSDEELMELRSTREAYVALKEKSAVRDRELFEIKEKQEEIELLYKEIARMQEQKKGYEQENEELLKELERRREAYRQSTDRRFGALMDIDEKFARAKPYQGTSTAKKLSEIVRYISIYGASDKSEKQLFYSEETIRCFLASMAASRLIILQGLSGTGKSSLPTLIKNALSAENSLIPVQPSWRDNRELLGYDNDFTRKFKATEFTQEVYKASLPCHAEKIWLVTLDEMNLARIEYYFADFLSVLEKDKADWRIPLVEENHDTDAPAHLIEKRFLHITPNIWFVGTANRDESTQGITDKVYDRAQVIDFDMREPEFSASCTEQLALSRSALEALFSKAEKDFALTREDMERIYFVDESMRKLLGITFGNRIESQMKRFIPVYEACGGRKEGGIDYILARKVLRKLENRFDANLNQKLRNFKDEIEEYYGEGTLRLSTRLIDEKISELGGQT